MESQSCVNCHQLLPRDSKLTVTSVSRKEADENGWSGRDNGDGTMMVNLCLQCQIDRSKNQTQQELNSALIRSYGSHPEES